MKLKISLFLTTLLFIGVSFAQTKRHQGLLWEISGNGLKTSSYLYGTMHVANKLAFNVSDSFYICLNKAQGIALESSPADWMQDYRDMDASSGGGYSFGNFYERAFRIYDLNKDVAYLLMQNKNSLMNQILYRFNSGSEDYQESTFLDMFIYQAGAKNGKPIHSLETLEEVILLSIKAMTPDKEKEEIDNKNNRYLDQDYQNRGNLMQDAYRRGDLDLIDSLSKSNNPTSVYHDYFIVERNRNMVNRIDSIMKYQSIFIGIGAAHLPGDGGAIEMLREMGYTLRAVDPKSTGKSHKMRKKLEELYKAPVMKKFATSDNFIQGVVPGTLFEMPTGSGKQLEYLCPETANGGYYSIIRQFTFGGVFGKTPEFYKESFDSLVYIATPGDLISKTAVKVSGYDGYRILTKTSKNALVDYLILFTPTEIIAIKGYGIGDYITKSEPKRFFTELEIAKGHSNWSDVTPKFGGATWKMKGLVTGKDLIDGLESASINPVYQSYDQETSDYFLVMRYTFNDLGYIEEDSFDLAYLGKTFAEEHGFKVATSTLKSNGTYNYIMQSIVPDETHKKLPEELSLKIITKGGNYYLMLTNSKNENATTFFDSFSFQDFVINQPYEVFVDTNLFYSVEILKKKEVPQFPERSYYNQFNEEEEDRSYLGDSGNKVHEISQTQESIYVGYVKFHDYLSIDSVDRFMKNRINIHSANDDMKISRLNVIQKDSQYIRTFLLTDTASSKGLLTQLILYHGVEYTIQTLIDTVSGPSIYVQHFFDTFKPKDTLIGQDLFSDKAQLFFDNIYGDDSLSKENALKSIGMVRFKEKDADRLIKLYRNYKFEEDDEQRYREQVLEACSNIKSDKIYKFLSEVYRENNYNAALQFSAIRALGNTESAEATDLIKNLILENPPFSENMEDYSFSGGLYDSLELTKNYFPAILDMLQYNEYELEIMELLAHGYMDSLYAYDSFKSEKSRLMRNAKIELKRIVASQKKGEEEYEDEYYSWQDLDFDFFNGFSTANWGDYYEKQYSSSGKTFSLLLNYYTLMCAFKKAGVPEVDAFFADVYRVEDKEFKAGIQFIHHKLGMPVDTAILNEIAQDVEYRNWLYDQLFYFDMPSYFDPSLTQEDLCFGKLYQSGYDEETDSVVFLRKEYVKNGTDEGYIYFFKRKEENKKNWMIDYVGVLPEEVSDTINQFAGYSIQKKGLAFKNDEEMEETIKQTLEDFSLIGRARTGKGNESENFFDLLNGY